MVEWFRRLDLNGLKEGIVTMKRLRKLIFVVLPCAMLVATAASADPYDHGRGHDRYDRHDGHSYSYRDDHHDYRYDRDDYRYDRDDHHYDRRYDRRYHYNGRWRSYAYRAGPAPWWPAYGYSTSTIVVMPLNTGPGSCNSQLVGTILGGTTGGLVGAAAAGRRDRLAGFAAGTVVGMLVGGAIGHSMDQADKYCVNQALETAPDGTSIHWNDGNKQYAVTPVRTGQDENGNYCREYQTQAQVAGKTQQVYGTACRKPDGSWQIIN